MTHYNKKSGEIELTLIDFNVAVDLSKDPQAEINQGPTGVKHWSAPETRSQSTYDQKSDIWSFGCLVLYIFTKMNSFYNELPED